MEKLTFNNMQDYATWKQNPIKSLDTKVKLYEQQKPGASRNASNSVAMEITGKQNILNTEISQAL